MAFDEESDDQDLDCMAELASRMSGSLRCPVFVVLDHDDDILWYQLYENGELIDEFDSTPGYFDPAAKPSPPAGGNAERLAVAFGASDVAAIEAVLRKSSFGEGGYTFAHQRHRDLVRALGLPELAVLRAYASFERGEYPDGISESQMLRPVGPPPVENSQLKEDREYYDQLGSEDLARPCKHEGCCRGAVRFSVLCKRHHFEMITHRECPFGN